MSWGKLLRFWILRTGALKRVVARAVFLKKQLLSHTVAEMLKWSFSSTSGRWISTRIKGSMSCGPAVAGRSLYPCGWACPWVVLSTLDSFHLEYGQCLYCLLLLTKSFLLVMIIHNVFHWPYLCCAQWAQGTQEDCLWRDIGVQGYWRYHQLASFCGYYL